MFNPSNFFKSLLVFVLLFYFFPKIIFAAEYFVSPSGSDSANGSSAAPWKTIQKAANTVSGGDTVNVFAGDYQERITISRSGSLGNQVVFRAQGTVYTKGFNVLANFITIDGFNATSSNTNWRDGWGIFVNGSNVKILNNFVYYSNGGIDIFHPPSQTTPTDNNLVKGNRLFRNRGRNIEVEGTNSIVEENDISAVLGSSNPPGSITGDLGDSDGIQFHGSGHIIRLNNIHDMSYSDPQMSGGHMDCFQTWEDQYHEKASNVIIERNICNLQTFNSCCIAHGFMLAQSENITIKNNLVKTIAGVNQGSTGVNANVNVFNNTFISKFDFSSAMYSVGVNTNGSTNYSVKNNIFYNFRDPVIFLNGYDALSLGHTYTNNIVYKTSGSPNISLCMGGCSVADPKFIFPASDYHLQSISPAIDSGTVLQSVAIDFDGISRPQGSGYDIGAYEFSNGQVPTTPPTVSPTIAPTNTPIAGDADGNGIVDEADYIIWFNHYPQNVSGQANGDFNNDSKVDGIDYVIWLNAFILR